MKIENVSIGDLYYVTCSYDCKSCFRVEVLEIVNDKAVKVIASVRHPSSKKKKHKHKPFVIPITLLHKTSDKAVHGYRQHHKGKKKAKKNKKEKNQKVEIKNVEQKKDDSVTPKSIPNIIDEDNKIYRLIFFRKEDNTLVLKEKKSHQNTVKMILESKNTVKLSDLREKYNIEILSGDKETQEEWLQRHKQGFFEKCESEDENIRAKVVSFRSLKRNQICDDSKVIEKVEDMALNDVSNRVRGEAKRSLYEISQRSEEVNGESVSTEEQPKEEQN